MAQAGSYAARELARILGGEAGLHLSAAMISDQRRASFELLASSHIVAQQVAAELAEKSQAARYPAVYVYCERVVNTLQEKFRTFSGKADLVIDVRVSHDRLEEMDRLLHLYVDAATEVLETNRGEWVRGLFYTGGYEVVYGPVKHGGRNYVQTAKIRLEVHVSVN